MAVSGKIQLVMDLAETGDNAYTDAFNVDVNDIVRIVNGTAAGQADILYANERTVATGANDDIDLSGVLTDAFGNTITAAELVSLTIINKQKSGTANSTDLTIGGGSNPFLGFLGGTAPTIGPLKPGARFHLEATDAAGIGTVTAGTADILRIVNSAGASNTYQIIILARSA